MKVSASSVLVMYVYVAENTKKLNNCIRFYTIGEGSPVVGLILIKAIEISSGHVWVLRAFPTGTFLLESCIDKEPRSTPPTNSCRFLPVVNEVMHQLRGQLQSHLSFLFRA